MCVYLSESICLCHQSMAMKFRHLKPSTYRNQNLYDPPEPLHKWIMRNNIPGGTERDGKNWDRKSSG